MKLTLRIECDCGNAETVDIVKSKHIIEDSIVISDSIEKSVCFGVKQSHADEITITCNCGRKEDVLI